MPFLGKVAATPTFGSSFGAGLGTGFGEGVQNAIKLELERRLQEQKNQQQLELLQQILGGGAPVPQPEQPPTPTAPIPPTFPSVPTPQQGIGTQPIPEKIRETAQPTRPSPRIKGISLGGFNIEIPKTEQEVEREARQQAKVKSRISAATKKVEQKTKIETGRLVSKSNLETISGVAHDLANVYKDAVKEGGAGGLVQKLTSGAATKVGDLPLPGGRRAEVGGKFSASGAFPGKRQELILKMMPMLTQQATKPEGSVRLITGVLDALGMTIPTRGTAPKTARRQLEESIRTFFRFTRSAELLGMDFDKFFNNRPVEGVSNEEVIDWVQKVSQSGGRIKIEGDELNAINELIDTALQPIDEIIGGGTTNNGDTLQRLGLDPNRFEIIGVE